MSIIIFKIFYRVYYVTSILYIIEYYIKNKLYQRALLALLRKANKIYIMYNWIIN